MADDRIDLSPLDRLSDEANRERLVARIVSAATDTLARRRTTLATAAQVARWRSPLLAAAAAVALIALGALTAIERSSGDGDAVGPAGLAEAIGVPQRVAQYIRGDSVPAVALFLDTSTERP